MGALDLDQVVELLAPVEEDFAILFSGEPVAATLRDYWPTLLERLGGEHLLRAFDILLGCDGHSTVSKEIDRRLKDQGTGRRDPLLLFYLEVARHIQGRSSGSRRFRQILDKATEPELQRLRQASSRLARHAENPLREALQEFSFEILDVPDLFADNPDTPYPASDDDIVADLVERIVDGELPMPPGMAEGAAQDAIVQELEESIDEAGMRGAPLAALRDFAGSLRADSETRQLLEEAAERCLDTGEELSRELEILLFPRRKGTRRRRR
jgi:hypothetical protein